MIDPVEEHADVFEEVVRRRREGGRTVLVTVVAAQGSTPRRPGARMLVLPGGGLRGTIGGGPKEAEVIAAAAEVLRRGGCRTLTLDFREGLTGGDGPICGGVMEVFMERIDPRRRVVIAGAGHVGYFLHRFLDLVDLEPVVLDPRPEMASAERFPGATLLVRPFEGGLAGLDLGPADGVVAVTPEHAHDREVVEEALGTAAGYVGMIGSRRKVAAILAGLREAGWSEEQVGRIHAPIGLDIGAESPAEIALAIAAEIVAVFKGTPSE